MSTSHEVILKGNGMRKEAIANAAITPGHFVEYMSTGKFRVTSVAGAKGEVMVAIPNYLVGRDLNTAYAAGDWTQVETCNRGMEVNALVAIGAPAILQGDLLEVAGDGTVRKHVVADSVDPSLVALVGQAMEAVDNSAGAALARIRVLIL